MTHLKFIEQMRNSGFATRMGQDGILVGYLTSNINITHSYKQNDQAVLVFTETQDRYLLSDDNIRQICYIVTTIKKSKSKNIPMAAAEKLNEYCQAKKLTKAS